MKRRYVLSAMVLLSACGGGHSERDSTVTVHAGESIQAAINAAPPNATIFVEPGVYHESATGPGALVTHVATGAVTPREINGERDIPEDFFS